MSTALATVQPQTLAVPSNPFEPQNLDQAMKLAETVSKSGLVPSALRGKPADILIILMTAREMRIGPMQALSDINVIQGKPVLSADLMVAQCKRVTTRCEWFRLVESTDDHATYEVKAAGAPEPERFTFSMADAKRLGLEGKDNWKKQPKTMLRRRAAAQAARETFPDLVRGYDPDEAEDFARPVRQVETVAVTPPVQPQPQTVDVDPQPVDPAPVPVEPDVVVAPASATPSAWDALYSRLDAARPETSGKEWSDATKTVVGKWIPGRNLTPAQLEAIERILFPETP